MKLSHKIIIGYLVITGMTIIVALSGMGVSRQINDAYRRVRFETIPTNQVLQQMMSASHIVHTETERILLNYRLEKNGRAVENLADMVLDESSLVAACRDLRQGDEKYQTLVHKHFPEETGLANEIKAAVSRVLLLIESLLASAGQQSAPGESEQRYARLEADIEMLEGVISVALKSEDDELSARGEQLEELIKGMETTTIAGLGLVLALALGGGSLLRNSITRPINELIGAAQKIATGSWGFKLEVESKDELGQLARAFNSMSVEIESNQVALQEMYAYSESVLKAMTNALMIVSSEGLIIRGNQALSKLTGRRFSELEGLAIGKILVYDWQELTAGDAYRGLSLETKARHKDGHEIPVMLSVACMRDEENQLKEFICVAQDISALKQAEEDRAAGSRFLDTVLNSLNDEICIIDAHSLRLLGCNEAFAKAHQVERNNILMATCHQVSHGLPEPCRGAEHPCPIDLVMTTGKSEHCEHLHTGADGAPRFFDIQCCPVVNDNGEIVQIVHVSRNITDQKLAEKTLEAFNREMEANNWALLQQTMELEQAHAELKESQSRILQQEKMASIGQLAAGVAHEINNPMGFIISNLRSLGKYSERLMDYINRQRDWILSASADGNLPEELAASRKQLKIDYLCDDLPELLEQSLSGADRVKQIVQDLKSFSRVDQQEFKSVDLNDCLDTTINMVWNELKYKVELVRDFGQLPPVACYPQQLNQVFMNILINAAQAIESSGEIVVKTRNEGEQVSIVISDNGCGIPPEVQHRVFEPFFTTKTVGQGTGLGMSIVFDIIKKHQGEIGLESTPGEGTTFTIILPTDLAAPEADAEERAAVEPPVAAVAGGPDSSLTA